MTQDFRIGVAGLGTVGAAVVGMIARRAEALAAATGRRIAVTAVSSRDRNRDRGLDLSGIAWFDDPTALARSAEVDCVVELIGGDDSTSSMVRPLKKKTIVQDGAVFTWQVDANCSGASGLCFDQFARPTRITVPTK